MLSRTADHLYWMARYMERAENTARLLDVNYQTSLLPQSSELTKKGWEGLLSISELSGDFEKRYGSFTARNLMDYMINDQANLASIRNCLLAARENARAVRGTLTTEVWETQNQTWLEFQRMVSSGAFQRDAGLAFEWVKFRSHLSRGVTTGTMLQDEAYHFMRLGSFIERADNTARLLDVKFHALESEYFDSGRSQSQSQGRGGKPGQDKNLENDFYYWSAILRSVSGFEIYRRVYRNVIRPERVAELLILRADMPRSLAACMEEVVSNLTQVANDQSSDTMRQAGRMRADLKFARIEEILSSGLHAYLTQFLERVGTLGIGVSRDFLVPVTA
jgi:uncharacterized alpha-E superfamily protein